MMVQSSRGDHIESMTIMAKDITNPNSPPNYLVSNEVSPGEFRQFVTGGTGGRATNNGFVYDSVGGWHRFVGYSKGSTTNNTTIIMKLLDNGNVSHISGKFRWDRFFRFN